MSSKICQSCGMPLEDEKLFGTNKDGSKNSEYCCYCYKYGEFTNKTSIEEFINDNLMFAEQCNMSEEEFKVHLQTLLPSLKRWQNAISLYRFKMYDYEHNLIDFEQYKNKVVLVVNTATKCGFTSQYDGLEELYKKYKDEGFEILDFPCNQFLFQAPGTSKEIHDSCVLRFMIEFKQFEKINVNGSKEHPLYTFLKSSVVNGSKGRIKWNFTKFLITRTGEVLHRFEPSFKPCDIEKYVKELLKK